MTIDLKPATPTQVVLRLASKNREELEKVSIQIADGKKFQDFKGFASEGSVERLESFQSSLNDIDSFIRSNDLVIGRVKTMDQAISQIQDIASDFSQLIARRRNGASGEDLFIDVEGLAALNDIAGKLNVKFDGRFLFGGSKTDTTPVQSITSSNLNSSNQPIPSYYNGDNVKLQVRSSNSRDVEYGILANEAAFQELIGSIHLAMDGHANDNDQTLSDAMDMIESSVIKLASIRAQTVSTINSLEEVNTEHVDVGLLVEENLSDVIQTDIVEATTRMSQLEATVQASFLAFTRLSELRLANFIR